MPAGDRTHGPMTTQGLMAAMSSVVPHGRARRLVTRARRVAGIGRETSEESFATIEWLMILEAIASEGGELQMLAEILAREALVEASVSRRPA
jgi:hypothetical protein